MHSADSEPCKEAEFRVSQSSSGLGSVMAAVEQQRRHDSSGLPAQGAGEMRNSVRQFTQ